MRDLGRYAVAYVSNLDRGVEFLPPENAAKFHPVTFEMLYGAANAVFGAGDEAGEYRIRHLVTFLAFFSASVAFFVLARRYLGTMLAAVLATLCLVCQPRIFADSFYNPKDIPFLVTYVFGALTLRQFIERRTVFWTVLHATACALSIATRIGGVFLVAVTLMAGAWQLLMANRVERKGYAWRLVLFAAVTDVVTVICWPVLWRSPVREFLNALDFLGEFPFIAPVLFNGEMMAAERLPWYYIPEWIAITTPIMVVAIIVAGVVFMMWQAATRGWTRQAFALDTAMLLLGILPLASVMSGKVAVYDGWRHLFFAFPILVLVGFKGVMGFADTIRSETRRPYLVRAAGAALVLNLVLTIHFMIDNHPHQNVYFNALAGKNLSTIRHDFDLDYWGLSYRQALEYILRHDPNRPLNIAVANLPGLFNSYVLPESDRARLRFIQDPALADYFIGNYRWHPDEYTVGEPFYSITVDGGAVITVRKVRRN